MNILNQQKLIVEKTLTYVYPKLCPVCRLKFRDTIIELGLATADDFASAMNLPF